MLMPPRKTPTAQLQSQPFRYESSSGKLFWASARPKVNVGDEAGWVESYKNTLYRRVVCGYHRDYAHRIIWEMYFGKIPAGMMVDHIDGNGLNNRLDNLRLVDVTGNARNARRPRTNTSGISGVSWSQNAGKWRAFVMDNGKQRHLGYFSSKEEAAEHVAQARSHLNYHPNHGRAA